MSNSNKRHIFKSLLLVAAAAFGARLDAATVNVEWDANTESNIAGYQVKYGTTPGQYTQSLPAGNVTNTDIPGLQEDKVYYFVVIAKTSAGVESAPSAEIAVSTASNLIADDDGDGMPSAWEAAHGLNMGDSGSTSVANGPLGDPDGDGIPNFLEYGFGLDPKKAGRDKLPATGKFRNAADGQNYLTLTFQKRLDTSRLVYTIYTSTDLKTWVPTTVTEVAPATPSEDGLSATVTVRLLTPISNAKGAHTYARLKVEDNTTVFP